ncbi:MAG: 4-alpha-glucanotransferase [Rhodospirillales bacterium]
MSDHTLGRLARAAGLAVRWRDAQDVARIVPPDTQRSVLQALGYPANSAAQIAHSFAALREAEQTAPPLLVAQPGERVELGVKAKAVELIGEDGTKIAAKLSHGAITAPAACGYYRIDADHQLAVAPHRAWSLRDAAPGKLWGVAAQVYGLRGGSTPGFGDFAALAEFAAQAGAAGANAVAISPVHALFGAQLQHFGPYSPSSRFFLNPLYGPAGDRVGQAAPSDTARLIDWPRAAAVKLQALRALYDKTRNDTAIQRDLRRFVREGGERLLAHARFETLDARFRRHGIVDWRNWPQPFADPRSAAVRALGANDPDIAFQLFLQWNAERGLAAAQRQARDCGMAIGLIADMAIGVDPAGSQSWSTPREMLRGLTIGAPPDLFTVAGQNWGLTGFSPHGLCATGYAGFIATLRAAMRHAGGIRLDHAMGLARLWLVPQGAPADAGAYLHYPMRELLGLLALESQRHRAVVIAEDLGVVPRGFRRRIAQAGLHGMRILWFEHDRSGAFLPPQKWDKNAAALSTTHDLPTIAGWWAGRDLVWRSKLGLDRGDAASKARARDRRKLWHAFKQANCASGPMPSPGAPAAVIDAACRFLAVTDCPLALLPVEDFTGDVEQPNLPGTIDQHPNWRRRLARDTPFATPRGKARARLLNEGRAK